MNEPKGDQQNKKQSPQSGAGIGRARAAGVGNPIQILVAYRTNINIALTLPFPSFAHSCHTAPPSETRHRTPPIHFQLQGPGLTKRKHEGRNRPLGCDMIYYSLFARWERIPFPYPSIPKKKKKKLLANFGEYKPSIRHSQQARSTQKLGIGKRHGKNPCVPQRPYGKSTNSRPLLAC